VIGGDEMDEEPLSQRMVSRSIERAQRQVEEHHFEMRKHVLDYDEVMDRQRKYIYAMRRAVLEDQDITARLEEMFANLVDDVIEAFAPDNVIPEEWDLEGMERQLHKMFHFDADTEEEDENGMPKPLRDSLLAQVKAEYHRREEALAEEMRQSFRERNGGDESRIDFQQIARKQMHSWELMALLRAVDDRWIQHLQDMDYLRESVRLRAFGQKDPLLEFKQEGFELFQEMVRGIEENTVETIFRLSDPEFRRRHEASVRQGTEQPEESLNRLQEYSYIAADKQADNSFSAFDTRKFNLAGQAPGARPRAVAADGATTATQEDDRPKRAPVRVDVKIGPNDPCPCGSGKKYKKCCGRVAD
jgi:preprotein translocase subunit SecA